MVILQFQVRVEYLQQWVAQIEKNIVEPFKRKSADLQPRALVTLFAKT